MARSARPAVGARARVSASTRAPAAALADLGAERDVERLRVLAARQHRPRRVDHHVFELAAADGAERSTPAATTIQAPLSRGVEPRASSTRTSAATALVAAKPVDRFRPHRHRAAPLSRVTAISTRSGVAGVSSRGHSR